jgi:hypothetical protein
MAERRNIRIQRPDVGNTLQKERPDVTTEGCNYVPLDDSDDIDSVSTRYDDDDDNDGHGDDVLTPRSARSVLSPRSAKKVKVLIGKVTLGVPARMDLDKACDVCNFLVGFGVSTTEFEAFANKLACNNRLVNIKDGKVGARGLGVLSRSLPDLLEFRRQHEALVEAKETWREIMRRRAQSVVSDVLTSAVRELESSSHCIL